MSSTDPVRPPGPLVNGRLVTGTDTVTVINPAIGAPHTECPVATTEHLDAAVDAAALAARAWAGDADLRRRALEALAKVLEENREALARSLSIETGIPLRDSMLEAAGAAGFARYRAAGEPPVDRIYDDERQRVQVRRAPVGVVGAIIPWNAPLLISAEKITTAFAAGNTVIVKPSPLAPLTTALLGSLAAEHLPPGVLAVLPGDDRLGAALVDHEGVGMISFTGSIAAGRTIMAAAAPRLKRLSLELGGNDAAIVLPDVTEAAIGKMAARVFQGAFYRSGQICAAIKRVYVHAQAFDGFASALGRLAESSVVGDPFDESVTMGPVSNRAQSDRVRSIVEQALAAGGTLVAGGPDVTGPGYFHRPTVVTGAAPDTALVAEEQFGPALPVLPYDDVEEAVAAANDTDFGLGASVWTTDPDRGEEVAAGLDAGSVWVNRHGIVTPEVPFGGMKQSGYGRANGSVGLDSYSELKTISVRR